MPALVPAQESAWRAAYEEARAAFPGVALALEAFLDHVAAIGAGEVPGSLPHAGDIYLARACSAGDAHALTLLEQRYLAPARQAVARFQQSPDFVDEVLQELRGKLLLGPEARIARYGGRGPLLAWIRVAASRTAIDLLRASKGTTATQEAGLEPLGQVDLGPEVQLLRDVYREAFQEALSSALGALSPKDRNILRRHVVERMTLEEIAGPYGVHPATVARRLQALREEIAEAVRARLATRHREEGGATSLESLARAIRSELEVSLSPLLASQVLATRAADQDDPGRNGGA